MTEPLAISPPCLGKACVLPLHPLQLAVLPGKGLHLWGFCSKFHFWLAIKEDLLTSKAEPAACPSGEPAAVPLSPHKASNPPCPTRAPAVTVPTPRATNSSRSHKHRSQPQSSASTSGMKLQSPSTTFLLGTFSWRGEKKGQGCRNVGNIAHPLCKDTPWEWM